jgi:hypothetical protein
MSTHTHTRARVGLVGMQRRCSSSFHSTSTAYFLAMSLTAVCYHWFSQEPVHFKNLLVYIILPSCAKHSTYTYQCFFILKISNASNYRKELKFITCAIGLLYCPISHLGDIFSSNTIYCPRFSYRNLHNTAFIVNLNKSKFVKRKEQTGTGVE